MSYFHGKVVLRDKYGHEVDVVILAKPGDTEIGVQMYSSGLAVSFSGALENFAELAKVCEAAICATADQRGAR